MYATRLFTKRLGCCGNPNSTDRAAALRQAPRDRGLAPNFGRRLQLPRQFPLTIPTSEYNWCIQMAANQSKERILAGAKDLFLARGYTATTVDAICEKAGLTKGSFYYFFESKEDLGLGVLDWFSVAKHADAGKCILRPNFGPP